jgi:hypothetical protein
MSDDEVTATGAIDWDMALAYELDRVGVCITKDNYLDDLLSLMQEIEALFDRNLPGAVNAIRTGMLKFEPDDHWFRIRRS